MTEGIYAYLKNSKSAFTLGGSCNIKNTRRKTAIGKGKRRR